MFGSKLCCFSDVKPFVLRLRSDERTAFAADVAAQQADVGVSIGADESPQKIAQRWVLGTQLQWLCGTFESTAKRTALVDELLKRFDAALPLGADLKSTEWQFADQYALTAVHVLTAIYIDTGDLAALHRAAFVLDRAIASSVSNMQLRLLASRVFTLLGATQPAWAHWRKCDVKQIQLDSVAYLMADHCMYVGMHFDIVVALDCVFSSSECSTMPWVACAGRAVSPSLRPLSLVSPRFTLVWLVCVGIWVR